MEILGVRAASVVLGIPEATLRYWRHCGQGPASFKLGRRLVYRREELDRWLAEQESATRRGGSGGAA
ncbi:helix-turn-helix domain-containing protein [Mycobacterium marinum]|uniref:helix-turn-helix transcriptional regulator n=1 Tax=Mycobacterium marinum TaxID=1781 RepID=UPI0023596D7A|nr:helix-turn-helix domain-containing protein [Mycobacterium marinum]MDC8982156.1 helix-turn-helix domain-containing protein [Mycobacterium marinum]MDC8998878.1 helix-turn-helix domain-containing protein [Mycobacterium marinum]MDC9009615.1 helix-turn-helix domain-containing protein [Mycobacterium marinum]